MSSLLSQLSTQTAALVEAVRPSIVCVGEGKARPRTGVVVAPGKVATLATAAEKGEKVPVHAESGQLEGTVAGFDPTSGVALLEAPTLTASLEMADGAPGVGELGVEVAVPIPGGHEARLSMIRCVGGPTRLPAGRKIQQYFQTDAARFRGFSAAVLLNSGGKALGITVPGGRRQESFVLPSAELGRIIAAIESGDRVGTAYLGVRTTAVELPHASDEHSHGLIVTGVDQGSPAEEAKLAVGEFIVAIDGSAMTEVDSLYDALHGRTEGETMTLMVMTSSGATETRQAPVRLRS